MFFSVSISNSEIGGPHVCTIKIPYSDEVRVSDIQRYDVVEFSWQSLRFKLVNKFIPVVKTQKVDKLRTVLQCCFGYTWNVYLNKCIPYCSNGCVHGNCTAPEICECYGNFGGLTCNFSCPLGFYGSICNNKCLCKNNATCDAFNGKCRCLEGWRGQYCDRPCRFGNYGKNCLKTCRCDHGNCDPTYGRCKCHSGWTGTFCNSLSQDGCICHNHGSCDINNGTCICSPGWFGIQCEKKIEPECQGSHCSENCICFNGTCNGNDTLGMCGCPRGFTGNMPTVYALERGLHNWRPRKVVDTLDQHNLPNMKHENKNTEMIYGIILFSWLLTALTTSQGVYREDIEYMLPKNVKPVRYNLTMTPNFETDSFFGTVLIEIIAQESSQYVTLHARSLNMPPMENITVQDMTTNQLLTVLSAKTSNSEFEYFTVSLLEKLIEGRTYVLTIPNFNARFSKSRSGFSSGTFQDENGITRYFAYTQFQPCDARRVFPSFDEPALRAKFNIKLTRPNEQFISASNSPVISDSASTFEDVFEETVDMPTYLVAFTISEMKFSETLDIYRIIARLDAINKNQHRYALELSGKIVDFMENYTNIAFTLSKLDQTAIPSFSGGMENWGLIVYGERSLLLINNDYKSNIAIIVAHEIAHQWFGNLVGITWWEYIWLNEGFATYFECLIPAFVESTIDARGLFIHNLQSSLQMDMGIATRPLTQNVATPFEISMLFDNIAYNKGGAVINMLEHALTSIVFQQGLKYYVETMQFGQATSTDLYKSLQKAVDESESPLPKSITVADFMYAWELGTGFPIVSVHRNYREQHNVVTLSQRYSSKPEGGDAIWIIPINFVTRSNPSFENTNVDYWITETQNNITLPFLDNNDWLIANKQETGYYRVNYDESNWKLITQALQSNHLDIHFLNRAQLIDDSLNLAKTGDLDNNIAQNLVEYIENERDPIPWKSYYLNSVRTEIFFYYSSEYKNFQEYNYNITKAAYNAVGFDEKLNETYLEKDLRKILLNLLCHLGHPECLHKSLLKYRLWKKSGKSLQTLEEYTLCGAIRSGTDTDFNYLFNELKHSQTNSINAIKGLSCSTNINNLNKLVELTDKITLNDVIQIVMSSGPEGLQAALEFVVENFLIIEQKLEGKTELLIKKICSLLSTKYHLKMLTNVLQSSKNAHGYIKMLEISKENIEGKTELLIKKICSLLSTKYHLKMEYNYNITKAAYNAVGFDEKLNETYLEKDLRKILLNLLCHLGHPECLHKSLLKYRLWKKSGKSLQTLEEYTLCGAIRSGTDTDFNYLFNELKHSQTNSINAIKGLSCSTNINNLNKYENHMKFLKLGNCSTKLSLPDLNNWVKMIVQLTWISLWSLSASKTINSDVDYMLPKNVKPIRYNLTIVPNFETDTFPGTVLIEITALETSNYVTLHVNNLNMPCKNDIVVRDIANGKLLQVLSAKPSNSYYNYFTISLAEMFIQTRTYVLIIPNFNAKFDKNGNGFSSGQFKDDDGFIRYFAYTQFQPCDARRAFPSFDEPGLRAKFNIRLVRPNQQFISAFNSRLISQSASAPFEDIYEETVNIPTYLVAFTISEMKYSETLDIYRIIARPEAINKNEHRYALELSKNIIDFMENYTHAAFSVPTLDQVAIIGFPGGMENWGLIVYGEGYLLLTNNNKKSIVSIVAHEIAHQWFGNLVGLTWWKFIWLNEGFATYFQNLIPEMVESNIDGRGEFIQSLHSVFKSDMTAYTRPLTQNAKGPTEIFILFDRIAYNKGGAIINMLRHSLTKPVFQLGLKYYVEKMQFGKATSVDLYESLQKAVDEGVNTLPKLLKVTDYMFAWEWDKGYPVVNVHRNYGQKSDVVTLTQVIDPESEDGRWIIPINFATSSNPSFNNTNPDDWITEVENVVSVPFLNDQDWLIANKKETGYYRVNYDEKIWELITRALISNHLHIHVLNRAQLIDDSLNLARTGHLDNNIALKLVEYIQNDQDPIPWNAYYMNMLRLATLFYYSKNYPIFKVRVQLQYYTYGVYNSSVGFVEKPYESTLQKELRDVILKLLCRLDHPNCLKKSIIKFKNWQKSRKDLHELEENISCGAIRFGNQIDFNNVFNQLEQMQTAPTNIIRGLSCSKNLNNLNKTKASIHFIKATPLSLLLYRLEAKTVLLVKEISELVSTDYHLNMLLYGVSKSKNPDMYSKMFEESKKNIICRKRSLNKFVERLTLTVAFSIPQHYTGENFEYMLPKNVKPTRYNLTIIPNFTMDVFFGTVSIEIAVLKTSNYITLHAHKLNMPPKENITVRDIKTGRSIKVSSAKPSNSKYQYFTISLVGTLIKNERYILTIPDFNAKFNKNPSGFASGTFLDEDGFTRYVAYTQFQPCDARRAFPCFDEPALRAKFNIRLVRPSETFISVSNAPLISQSTTAPFEDVYEETVEMPTYLVAFTISEMIFSETLSNHRIIARPEAIKNNEHLYALDISIKIVDFMESFTNMPYALPKLDQVAINYFPGGMENWGLIIYGENYLLLDKEIYKQTIVPIVCHEIAHQWFGNLVGITWWKYIWLNEGFATYFEYLLPPLFESSIDGRGSFTLNMQYLFRSDIRGDTRPLTQNAYVPTDIFSLFDNIAYEKGGIVLHMLEHSITTSVFQLGLQYYVEKMQYGQASSTDLYESLQKAVDEDANPLPKSLKVADFMLAWEFEKGFPVVNVIRHYGENNDIVTLTQKHYSSVSKNKDGKWIIPINFATNSKPTFESTIPDYWISKTETTVSIPFLNNMDWLIANKKETGYYRVNYDETNWKLIARTLLSNHLDIHVLNRAQIIDDSWNLAKDGHLDEKISKKIVNYILYEKDPIPWLSFYANSLNLATSFYYSTKYQIFKEYNYNITKLAYNYIGFEEKPHESYLEKNLRKVILDLLCHLDHPECLNKSLQKFRYSLKCKEYLPLLDENTLCGAIRSGNEKDFDYLFNELMDIQSSPINVIKGLSCSKNITNLNKIMQLEDKLPQDKIIEIVIKGGPEGLHAAIMYIGKNFAIIEKKLERKFGLLLRKISELVSTNYHLNVLLNAFSSSRNAQLYTKIFEQTKKNMSWKKNNLSKFANILNILV
ncbi:hypothetical protein FQR65_LT12899 [Abscondita terminalis]|nr:hypothetical protein FQR65_LT12899 [Abscondita terminalis]